MNKKITGVPENKEQARDGMIRAKSDFKQYIRQLEEKKVEYKVLKADNDIERQQIRHDMKEAEKFKFGNMKKKISFLPSLHQKGEFKIQNSVHAIGVPYMDNRDKMRLCMPDKTFLKNQPQWTLQKTCDGKAFEMSVRQEKDVYDLDLLKYMKSKARGIPKPPANPSGRQTAIDVRTKDSDLAAEAIMKGTQSVVVQGRGRNPCFGSTNDDKSKTVRYMPVNSLKWDPNGFAPTLLQQNYVPLMDNTMTPRGQKKAITLERSFDQFAFMYNRNNMESFSGVGSFQIEKDKKRSKMLKKTIRMKKKNLAATFGSGFGSYGRAASHNQGMASTFGSVNR